MAIDAYEPCVCGSGKKVKFCCSKDIMGELDRVFSAINSDQRVAALEQINRLLDSKGDRDCLLVTKSSVLIQLKQLEKAQEIVDRFLENNPENALVLAQAALLAMTNNDVDGAVVLLQNALDQPNGLTSALVVDAIRMVGMGLLMEGRLQAARTHLIIYQRLVENKDNEVTQMLARTYSSTQVPVLLKQDFDVQAAPEGVEWFDEMGEILALADQARFRFAIERLRELEAKFPCEPVIRRNIAVLESRLGDVAAMVDAWGTYARTAGVDIDSAVEAEAMAQLLDDDPDRDFIDEVEVSLKLDRHNDAIELMLGHPQFELVPEMRMPTPPEGSPPAKAMFLLIDREMPADGTELELASIPHILANVFVYGKETDRDARLTLVHLKDDSADERIALVSETLKDFVGEVVSEEVVDRYTRQSTLLTWRWRLPPNTPDSVRDRLAYEKHRETLLETWPTLELDVLDGQSPTDAAADEAYRIPLLAAILLMEQTGDYRVIEKLDLNLLRKKLGLPAVESIDPAGVDLSGVSLVQFCRLDVEKLDDDGVLECLRRAMFNGLPAMLQQVLRQVIARDIEDKNLIDAKIAHLMLARLVEDHDEALELITKGREIAVENGEMMAEWLIHEFEIRLERGIKEGTEQLFSRIDRDHMHEAGVAQRLAAVLSRFGLLDPQQAASVPDRAPAAEAPAQGSVQNQMWVPSQEREPAATTPPEAPNEDGPSKLWLPGMD